MPCGSPGSLFSTLWTVFSSCDIMLSIWCRVAAPTLPSTQSNCSCIKTSADPCWTLGPCSDLLESLCAYGAASLSAPPLTALSPGLLTVWVLVTGLGRVLLVDPPASKTPILVSIWTLPFLHWLDQ